MGTHGTTMRPHSFAVLVVVAQICCSVLSGQVLEFSDEVASPTQEVVAFVDVGSDKVTREAVEAAYKVAKENKDAAAAARVKSEEAADKANDARQKEESAADSLTR